MGSPMRGIRTPELEAKIRRRMEVIDSLTPDQRKVVHDFGWHLVKEFMQRGVTRPKDIRALVNTVLNELRPPEIEAARREMERQ